MIETRRNPGSNPSEAGIDEKQAEGTEVRFVLLGSKSIALPQSAGERAARRAQGRLFIGLGSPGYEPDGLPGVARGA
jgi:hypothetical protein